MTTTPPSEIESNSNRSRLRAAGVAVGLLLAGLLVLVATNIAAALVFGLEPVLNGGTGFYASFVGGQAMLLLLALAYVRWHSLRIPVGVPSRDESLLIGGTVAVSVAAAFALDYLLRTFVSSDTSNVLSELITANPSLALVVGGLSVVLIAPAEELLYRGAIQGRLGQAFGTVPAVVGASLLFAASHLQNFSGSVLGAVFSAGAIGAVSLLWGYAYERTDNFAVPVLTHGLYNLTLLLIAYARL